MGFTTLYHYFDSVVCALALLFSVILYQELLEGLMNSN
jgi:hypothetical protein